MVARALGRYEPWYFASSDSGRADNEIGRFDLPRPQGTCYVGYGPAAVSAEHLRICGVSAAEAQKAAALRRVSPLGLDRWHGKPIADFTSPAAHDDHGAPGDIALVDRAEAREWAVADALALVLLVVDEPRFRRAAARWLQRMCVEQRITLHQLSSPRLWPGLSIGSRPRRLDLVQRVQQTLGGCGTAATYRARWTSPSMPSASAPRSELRTAARSERRDS